MSWDIDDLFLGNTGWLRRYRGCGIPSSPLEDPSGCGNTVEVDGACHLAGTVNYAMYGTAMKLCHDYRRDTTAGSVGLDDTYNPEDVAAYIERWKRVEQAIESARSGRIVPMDNPGPPSDWALATYHFGPGGRPTRSNRPDCSTDACPAPPVTRRFRYSWPPLHGSLDH